MMIRTLLLVFGFLSLTAVGQHFRVEKEISFEQVDMSTIEQTERDTSGFLWIRTGESVYRYDGKQFERYYQSEQMDHPSVLFTAPSGRIIVGTQSGRIFTFEEGEFRMMDTDSHQSPIVGLFEMRGTVCWVHQDGNIELPFQSELTRYSAPIDFIYTISHRDRELYLGTDHGLYRMLLSQSEPTFESVEYERGREKHIVTALKNTTGDLLIGHYDGSFSKFNETSSTFFPAKDRSAIRSIDQTGEFIWLGTHADGLFAVSQHIDSTFHIANIEEKRIIHLSFDVENNLWVNSNRSVYRVDPFVEFWDCPLPEVQAFVSEDHRMWAGTSAGFFTGNTASCFELVNADLNVASICKEQDLIWVGTLGMGLYLYSSDGILRKKYDAEDGLENTNVMDIRVLDNRVYVATLGGVYVSDDNRNRFQKINSQSQFIYALLTDRENRIWIGTDGRGLECYRIDQGRHERLFSGLEKESVIAIAEQPNGDIYVATDQNQVFSVRDDTVQLIDIQIPIDYGIMGLNFNQSDELMIWTEKGLWLYHTARNRVTSLSQYNRFWDISSSMNGSYRDDKGRLWVSNATGIYELHANKHFCTGKNLFEISSSTMNTSKLISDGSSWKSKFNTAQFSFSQLNFNSDCEYEFEYRLLGYVDENSDCEYEFEYRLLGYVDEWTQTADYKVIFPSLPHGDYRFELRQFVPGGGPRSEIRSVRFTILKPWFQTWWFYTFSAIAITGVILAVVIQRERNLVVRNRREQDKIRAQFELLKNQVNPHFLFNSFNTLTDMVEQQSSEAVTYIEKLSSLFRSILAYRKKELITVAEEIKIVENYLDLQKHRFEKGLSVEIELAEEVYQTYIPPLTMQLLIENAIKHNTILPGNPLRIRISSNAYVISIANNRIHKFETKREEGTGYGLNSIVERYRFFTKNEVVIQDNDNEFIVELPLILNA